MMMMMLMMIIWWFQYCFVIVVLTVERRLCRCRELILFIPFGFNFVVISCTPLCRLMRRAQTREHIPSHTINRKLFNIIWYVYFTTSMHSFFSFFFSLCPQRQRHFSLRFILHFSEIVNGYEMKENFVLYRRNEYITQFHAIFSSSKWFVLFTFACI